MNWDVVIFFSPIAVFGVLIYFMFVTRRTILRIFGRIAALFALLFIFANCQGGSSATDGAEATKIINDLRNLRSATLLFYEEFGTWPSPEQGASLDAYSDRPMVLAKPPRYAKVILAEKLGDANGPPELYIGVVLTPYFGVKNIQEKLAKRASDSGLFQGPVSGDVYKSGLSVYMRIDIPAKP
jgi:hypothetical protein